MNIVTVYIISKYCVHLPANHKSNVLYNAAISNEDCLGPLQSQVINASHFLWVCC